MSGLMESAVPVLAQSFEFWQESCRYDQKHWWSTVNSVALEISSGYVKQ